MKKLALILAILTVLTVLALPAAAVEAGKNLGELPQTTEKITIDGKKDTIYDQGMKFDCTLPYDATKTTDTTIKGYLLWDGKKTFYAFVEVKDKTPVAWTEEQYKKSPWSIDSIELFFDFNNDGKDRDQYRIDNGGKPTYYDTATKYEGLDKYGFDAWGFQKTSDGYCVEFQISDYRNQVKAGGHVGIDAPINDMKDASTRIVYNYKSSQSSKGTVTKFDYIVLGTKVVTNPVATTKAAATTAAKAATTAAAKTADVSVIVAAVAVAALAGVVVCKKKH